MTTRRPVSTKGLHRVSSAIAELMRRPLCWHGTARRSLQETDEPIRKAQVFCVHIFMERRKYFRGKSRQFHLLNWLKIFVQCRVICRVNLLNLFLFVQIFSISDHILFCVSCNLSRWFYIILCKLWKVIWCQVRLREITAFFYFSQFDILCNCNHIIKTC